MGLELCITVNVNWQDNTQGIGVSYSLPDVIPEIRHCTENILYTYPATTVVLEKYISNKTESKLVVSGNSADYAVLTTKV